MKKHPVFSPIWVDLGKVFDHILGTFVDDVLGLRFDVFFVDGSGCFLLFVVLSLVTFLTLEC